MSWVNPFSDVSDDQWKAALGSQAFQPDPTSGFLRPDDYFNYSKYPGQQPKQQFQAMDEYVANNVLKALGKNIYDQNARQQFGSNLIDQARTSANLNYATGKNPTWDGKDVSALQQYGGNWLRTGQQGYTGNFGDTLKQIAANDQAARAAGTGPTQGGSMYNNQVNSLGMKYALDSLANQNYGGAFAQAYRDQLDAAHTDYKMHPGTDLFEHLGDYSTLNPYLSGGAANMAFMPGGAGGAGGGGGGNPANDPNHGTQQGPGDGTSQPPPTNDPNHGTQPPPGSGVTPPTAPYGNTPKPGVPTPYDRSTGQRIDDAYTKAFGRGGAGYDRNYWTQRAQKDGIDSVIQQIQNGPVARAYKVNGAPPPTVGDQFDTAGASAFYDWLTKGGVQLPPKDEWVKDYLGNIVGRYQ